MLIVEIDPAKNSVRMTIPLVDPVRRGRRPSALVYRDGLVWVAIE